MCNCKTGKYTCQLGLTSNTVKKLTPERFKYNNVPRSTARHKHEELNALYRGGLADVIKETTCISTLSVGVGVKPESVSAVVPSLLRQPFARCS